MRLTPPRRSPSGTDVTDRSLLGSLGAWPTWKPAKSDCLCTEHFEDEDYKTSPKLLQSLGLPVKQAYLKPGVVPSLFTRKRKRERHSGAVDKRRRMEVWNRQQNELFEQASGRELVLAGDGRKGYKRELLALWQLLGGTSSRAAGAAAKAMSLHF
ncbi:hypothetical protein HPB47_014904 [Ixodes persulcatus]|uniref:Uncharacterized protein n=1 Tax=Ixodes persulcatus TaxID=34615 RepID=A0AC60QUU3_IXOPE|nr:hypothetical protein HPB47_014904 [Ixodes persulcatus]